MAHPASVGGSRPISSRICRRGIDCADGRCPMSMLLLLTSALQPSADVLPGLALLPHQVKILPAEGSALLEAPSSDLVLIDGRRELAHARDLCRLIRTTGSNQPVLLIVTEGGLAVVAADWGFDDVILD